VNELGVSEVSPGTIVVGNEVSPGEFGVEETGAPPRLAPVGTELVPEWLELFVLLGPLLLWELLCCVPPTAPPTAPPMIRMMMMTIAVIPQVVRYHGAFFA
jgi:hypothetical protein